MKLTERNARKLEMMFNIILDGRGNEGELVNAARLVGKICREAEILNFEALIRTFAPAVGGKQHKPGSYEDLMEKLHQAMSNQTVRTWNSTGTGPEWQTFAWQEDADTNMPEWTKYPNMPVFTIAQRDPDYLRTAARKAAGDVTNPASIRFARLAHDALKAMGKPGL